MKAGRLALTLGVGLALILPGAAAWPQKPRAERPTYNVGDQWVLTDGLYDLIRIDKDRYVFAAGTRRQIQLTKNLVVADVLRDGVWEWSIDPAPELSWPLEVGKWGVLHRAILRSRDHPAGVRVRVAWEVKAYEDVAVAGAVFKAFQILYSVDIDLGGVSRPLIEPGPQYWRLTVWYAPEARRIVKTQAVNADALNWEAVALDRPPAPAAQVTSPVQVVLNEPKDQASVTGERITVGGRVTAGTALKRITATLNGIEVFARDLGGAPGQDVALSFPVAPRDGKNVLVVTAEDAHGTRKQEARVFFRDQPSSPAPPPGRPVPPAAPLKLTISSPVDRARVDHDGIALAGLVSGGTGVSRVMVTVNGVEVVRLEERTPRPVVPLNLPLKLRDGQNVVVVTATGADGTTQQEVRTVDYERSVPLTVQVRHPEDGAHLSDSASLAAAVASSSRGVTEVNVILNGTQVHQQRERTPRPSVAVAVPIKLREGTNTIVVRATQADGVVHQEVRTVVYQRAHVTAAALAAPAPSPTRDRWAVVIGVGSHQSPDIPPLRFTVADADAFYRVLVDRAGFKKENVLLLTDKTERKPTLRNIKWALGTFLARSARKDDLVVIFFAGHGAPEVDPRGAEADGLSKYLVPIDADPGDLYSTAVPMEEFQIIFDRIEADRVVVFLDACYSGAAGGRTFASKRTRATRVDDLFLERLVRAKGRAIITGARGSEVSLELPELGAGIFTHYLVQGLNGAADLDRDGIVSLQELYSYVEQEVSRKSRTVGGNQHPVMKGEMEGLLPLVKVRGQ